MKDSTSDKNGIKKFISESLLNATVLSITFKDIDNSHNYPSLISCDSLSGSKLTYTGLLPTQFFGLTFTVDIDTILGCGTYDMKTAKFREIVLKHLAKQS